MSLEVISLGFDLAPVMVEAVNRTLGRTEVARLFEHLDRAVGQSDAVPPAVRKAVRKKVSGLRVDPEFGACLHVLLARGEVAVEPAMRQRLSQLLAFGDDRIHDIAVVDLVCQAVFESLHRAASSDRDAAHIEHGRTRAGLEDVKRHVSEQIAALGAAQAFPDTLPMRFNVPPVAAAFTGRELELAALDRAFMVDDSGVVVHAVVGLGGVGKSQLAARYLQRHLDDHDIAAWIRAEDGGIADLAALAARLGLVGDELAPSDHATLAVDWLGRCERSWMLVLDDVRAPAQLPAMLPHGRGQVLVTSRDRALNEFGGVLQVGVFDEETATAYLVDRSGRMGDDQDAHRLAVALGCLPLALSHAAAFCDSGTSFADYRDLLAGLPAGELFDSHPEQSYAHTVASTWRVSIEAASELAPLARDVLDMAAFLGPEDIPRHIFATLVADGSALSRKRLGAAFNALTRYSLATVDDRVVGVHRLLQRSIRDDTKTSSPRGAAFALDALCAAFPEDVALPSDWPTCEQLVPHVHALVEADAIDATRAPRLLQLYNRLCHYLNRAEPGIASPTVAAHAAGLAAQMLGPDHVETLTARNHLAFAYLATGRQQAALGPYEALLRDCDRVLGRDHELTLITRNDLASAYRDAGRSHAAIRILEALLEDRTRILGADAPSTLKTCNNLARAYHASGRARDAIAIYEPLVLERERVLGADHPDVLRTRENLASSYLEVGRVAEAIAIYEPLLLDCARVLGADHPDALSSRASLALAYDADERSLEATAILKRLIEDYQRILGPAHPKIVDVAEHLARISAGPD